MFGLACPKCNPRACLDDVDRAVLLIDGKFKDRPASVLSSISDAASVFARALRALVGSVRHDPVILRDALFMVRRAKDEACIAVLEPVVHTDERVPSYLEEKLKAQQKR